MLQVQTITLTIAFDDEQMDRPDNWNWDDLIDTDANVSIVASSWDATRDPTAEEQAQHARNVNP